MKKIVVLNGSPHSTGKTITLVNEVLKTMEKDKIQMKTFNLNTMKINGCQGCYACKKTGKCIIKDDMQSIYRDIDDADSIIFATPVHIWQMTAQMKLAIDRLYAYMKQDYSSFLSPNKKFSFVVTFGGGNLSQYQDYFESVCKSLVFMGFGEYKILITGGLMKPTEIFERLDLLSDAKELGEWLLA